MNRRSFLSTLIAPAILPLVKDEDPRGPPEASLKTGAALWREAGLPGNVPMPDFEELEDEP